MAYAAVLSLSQILEQISNPHLEQHQTPLQDQQIKSLQEKLKFFQDFLDDSWQRRSRELQSLEMEIRDAAYKTEDIMESHISKNFGQESFHERQIRDQTFCENFVIVADEIDSIKMTAAKLKELWGSTDLYQSKRTSLPTGQSRLASSGKSAMVGFHDDLNQIVDQLTGHPPTRKVIPIIGMGGIGKTTLARNVYNDPRITEYFHIRAWASISQEYHEREVLLSLLNSMEQLSVEILHEEDTGKLKEYLYKSLNGRIYLVVMDDVWTTKAWDSLSNIFPNDRNGSRIMLTTRLLSVVDFLGSPHHMRFLNATESWNLLRQEVFGEDSCPVELEEAGKEISDNCKGLALSLVVIGGHLSKANGTKDHWEYVAQNVKSVVNATDANCLDILSLSYDYLPHYLKACFLYMGVFPEDDEIRVSKLIKLWAAEGFLKPVRGKTLEKVAEECLGDLISRNLIMISKKSPVGKIKTCGIHDMLRDLCLKKAQEEEFFLVRDKENISADSIKYPRRLCIHPDILHEEFKCYQSMRSLPTVRSILISRFPEFSFSEGRIDESQINELVDGTLFPLLRVLDLKHDVQEFPFGEIKLVHSRYLALSCYGKVSVPKTLPDFFGHLQTLIVNGDDVDLPEEIWRMTQLRHLMFEMCYLPCPTRSPIAGENFVLENLLTLSNVNSSSRTKEVFERVPNLKKLGIFIGHDISLRILVNLPQLETLKIEFSSRRVRIPINFTFPPNIKKLTLECHDIAWKHMTIVGSMPNLEVLKLRDRCYMPKGKLEWEPTEGEFPKLKFLEIRNFFLEQWRANDTNFTRLECLMLREGFNLKEIPHSIGHTLQIIDLDNASPSAVTSAKQIQEEQEEFGNDIQVRVLDIRHKYNVPQSEELEQNGESEAELIANLESNDEELQISACSGPGIVKIALKKKEVLSRIVPRLLMFLDRDDYPQLQLAAAWAIVYFSEYSDSRSILIEQGAVSIIVSLLSSPNDKLRVPAFLALRNIVRLSASPLSYGKLIHSLAQFNDRTNLANMRNATVILSELCARRPQLEQVKSAVRPLSHLIHEHDETVLMHACKALFNLTCGKKDIKQALIDAGVFPRLVELLKYHDSSISSSSISSLALRTIGSIISYVDDTQIQVIIDDGALCYLRDKLILNYDISDMESICHIISNITGRTKDHIQAVIEAGIISPLLPLLQDADFFNTAVEVIYNATTKGTDEQIKFLVHEGCIEPMCDLLVNPYKALLVNPDIAHVIKICLEGLENILKVGEAEKNQGNTEHVNVFARMIENAGGLQKMKNLKTCDSEICQIAGKILVTYWHQEDDNDED